MFGRNGAGRSNWRQRDNFEDGYQRSDRKDHGGSHDYSYQQTNSSDSNWDYYDSKRQRVVNSRNHGQQSSYENYEDGPSVSYQMPDERPPPHFRGKGLASYENYEDGPSVSYQRPDERPPPHFRGKGLASYENYEDGPSVSYQRPNERPPPHFRGKALAYYENDDDRASVSYQRPHKERPPPHLKGKALGMWFRDRNREKQKKEGLNPEERAKKNMMKRTSIPIELPPQKIRDIRNFLDSIGVDAPPTISQIRMNNEGCSVNIQEKYSHLADSEFKRSFIRSISGTIENKIRNSVNNCLLDYKRDSALDSLYLEQLSKKENDPAYLKMLDFRKRLPAYEKEYEIIDALEKHQVILISGETGCGKTTQVPQFILDHQIKSNRGSLCHIMCTQPRRISAISVAERVAEERAEKLGCSVGYHIRLEHARPRATGSIMFCTTGILLQIMQNDTVLKQVSHVILDEIHERDTLSDFAITILRDLIKMRKDLKIILMSATLNSEQFSKYFDNCPNIHIPGFTYHVTEYYLEDVLQLTGVPRGSTMKKKHPHNFKKKDEKYIKYKQQFLEPYIRNMRSKHKYSEEIFNYMLSPEAEEVNLDLIVELLLSICKNEQQGAILVFLPGWDKISALVNKMTETKLFHESEYLIIPLHSMMPTVAQKTIFDRPPPGKRKIVIATNIAETSITIDDVVYVIDCAKIKLKNFDVENNVTTLKEEWVSLANARQRKGRAGRVQEGICYHLYTRPKELVLESYQLPEMLRTRLEEVILQVKILQLGKAELFLSKVMDPPPEKTVKLSINLLKNMNALDSEEYLTPLGYHLANLPVDPQAGKMILLAALFSCVDPITSIAASLSFKDPFFVPLGKEKEVKKVKMELAEGSKSDHILTANVMKYWRQAESEGSGRSFTSRNFLSYNTLLLLKDMKKQFVDHLYEMKFLDNRNITADLHNMNSDNNALLRSIICAGLYPNIAVVKTKKKRPGCKLFTAEDGKVCIHIKSVNYQVFDIESSFVAYFLKIKSTSIQMHDTSMVFPMSLIFFCQSFTIQEIGSKKLIQLNNNICFKCDPDVASIIQELRAWLDWLLEFKIAHPGTINWSNSSDETLILNAIVVLLTAESRLYLQEYSDNSDDEIYLGESY